MTTYPLKCRIAAQADGVTRVDVYDDIGPGGWLADGLTAKAFAAQISGVRGGLEVHINSAGGDVFDGVAIKNAIEAHPGRVTTVVDGLAASIASVIAQAGAERVMQPGSMMMIHDAFAGCVGDAAEFESMAATLNAVSDNIAAQYAARAGGTPEQWRAVMRGEAWYTAEEAVAAGLADRVGDRAAHMPPGLDVAAMVPGRIAARLRGAATEPWVSSGQTRHEPMTGTHSHDHAAMGAADHDDGIHAHTHTHRGDALHDHEHPHVTDRAGRVLGIESMPLLNKALPVHHTATEDGKWDGPAAVAAMPSDGAVLRYCHAWEDSAAASADDGTAGDDHDADDEKKNYKFPHHKAKGGPAFLAACRNGLARLSGADIPEGDRAGVEAHLRAHLKDGGDDAGEKNHADLPAWLRDA